MLPDIAISSIDLTTDVITTATHGWSTGFVVGFSTTAPGGTLPTSTPQVTVDGVYFVRVLSATTVSLHPTRADALANTAKINFTVAGTGTAYLSRLSVRERIVRQLQATLRAGFAAALGSANIQRYDGGNNNPVADASTGALPAAWILITPGPDDVDNEESTIGLTRKVMPITIDAHLLQPAPNGKTLDQYGNDWLALLEQVVHADPNVTEAGSSAELAHDMLVGGTSPPEPAEGNRDMLASVEGEIHYDHAEADPYTGRSDGIDT